MKISIRTLATLVSSKWLLPDKDEFWEACNFVLQSDMTNMTLFSRGAKLTRDVLAERHPELLNEDYSVVKDKETCDAFVSELEQKYGSQVEIHPSDRPFLELTPVEEWAHAKGISIEEAEASIIVV